MIEINLQGSTAVLPVEHVVTTMTGLQSLSSHGELFPSVGGPFEGGPPPPPKLQITSALAEVGVAEIGGPYTGGPPPPPK
jgi:hypothetical protein